MIATRAAHAELTARALEAGKHVFCEKPLALTLEELEQVFACCGSTGDIGRWLQPALFTDPRGAPPVREPERA